MNKKIREYVMENQDIFVGLEDSKRTWKICVRSGGIIVNETGMPADYKVLKNYFNNRFPGCRIKVIYEAGFRGFSLNDQIESDGWECIVTPPHTVTEEKCQRQKNDTIDCRRLAKNLENGDYQKCYVPDKQLREDRQISRILVQVQRDITRTCNRIRRSLEFHGLDPYFRAGCWNKKDYKELKQRLGTMGLSSALSFSLNTLLRELEFLWDLKKETTQELRLLAKSDRYRESVRCAKSVPGIGLMTAIRLILEWGDLSRFKRKEEFASFLGLIPWENSSGEKERKGHITKQGCRWVRSWLVESSWIAIRKDPAMLDKYKRVVSNCGSKKKAIVAVARKLAIRLRSVVMSGEEYIIGVMEQT
jgi:transposase